MPILAIRTPLIRRTRRSLVAANTDSGFDISLVVPTLSCFLCLQVRLIAFLTTCIAAIRPTLATADTNSMLFTKCTHQCARILVRSLHGSGHDNRQPIRGNRSKNIAIPSDSGRKRNSQNQRFGSMVGRPAEWGFPNNLVAACESWPLIPPSGQR